MAQKKTKLRKQADKLWYKKLFRPKCEVCGKRATQVHHFYYKGNYSHLRYDLDNGISICQSCHYKIHFKDPKEINEIIREERGNDWYMRLREKAMTKDKNILIGYKSVKYYEDVINDLS